MIKYLLLENCLAVVAHVSTELHKLEKHLERRTEAAWFALPKSVRRKIDAGENLFI
jgi:hypothetical protein